jgi:hypothetical protein
MMEGDLFILYFAVGVFALLIAGLVLMEYEDPIDTDKKK